MKKNLIVIISMAIFATSFIACNESDEVNEVVSTEDMTLIEDVLNSIEETADIQTFGFSGEEDLETRNSPCVEITSSAPLGEYPNTITMDFGDGCEGPHGRLRKGKMIIDISDKMENEGAIRTVSFDEFFVEDVQLLGTRSMTNLGLNDAGLQQFQKEVSGIQLIFPNGDVASRDATHLLTFMEGYDTGTRWDNKIAITGTSSGTGRNGVAYNSEIVEALIKRGNCRWIVAGIKEITRDDQAISLDYGDGACNRAAVVTFEDGTTKEINLHRKWW